MVRDNCPGASSLNSFRSAPSINDREIDALAEELKSTYHDLIVHDHKRRRRGQGGCNPPS